LAQCGCWGYEAGKADKIHVVKVAIQNHKLARRIVPAGGYAWGVVCL